MVNKQDYRDRLQLVINQLHKCGADWIESVPIHETFNGQTVWKGDVEVYDLRGHPKANRCFGWSYGDPERFITILKLPPVTDAASAVKVGVTYQIKKRKNT